MRFWVETKIPKSWMIGKLCWWCIPPLKCQNSTFVSIAESVHCRLLKLVPSNSPTQVSYPHFIHCFASTPLETELLTKNDFYDMTSS